MTASFAAEYKAVKEAFMSNIDLTLTKYQKENLKLMVQSYHEFVRELRIDPDYHNSEYISENIKQFLDDHITNSDLNNYSGMKFYWLTLIEKLIYLDSLHEELEESDQELSSEIEGDIFEFWNKSEYMQAFLELMDKNADLIENSLELLPLLENQIISYYYLHINQSAYDGKPLLYNIIPEIGDSDDVIYIGESLKEYRLPNNLSMLPSLLIKAFDNDNGEITLNEQDKDIIIKSTAKAISLKQPVKLIPFQKDLTRNIDNIEKALEIIKKVDSKLYNTFCEFTKVIVPVDDPGLVSYSMQELPGFSSINLFNRDFVDLLDDLLHENGHHYLNSILNHSHLINEDDEMIYYSPWRKSRRPIRGIYHAYFTFYWALLLFDRLTNSDETTLDKDQLSKCEYRFCEEHLMLDYCWKDLLDAKDKGKIEIEGMDIIIPIQNYIEKLHPKFDEISKELDNSQKENINNLKKTLEKERGKVDLF